MNWIGKRIHRMQVGRVLVGKVLACTLSEIGINHAHNGA